MRLRINRNKDGTKNYYILESYRTDAGKSTTRIVQKLGTHEELLKSHEDPEAWAQELVAQMTREAQAGKQQIMIPFHPNEKISLDEQRLYDGGYLFLQKLFYRLRLDYICKKISEKYHFEYKLSQVLGHLVYARVLNPCSKLATFDYSQSFLEPPKYALEDMYRALEVIGEEKDYIQSALYQFSKGAGKRNDKVLYYDCTNYYFEIEQESGLRKYGPSKEHRPNPIVEMGMFMDGDGIPLAFCIHSGNTNEQKTLRPLEEQIMNDFGHAKFIVCTDAGLSSAANRRFNDAGDRAFITAQSIKKMKAFQREWALERKGWRLPGRKESYNLDDILSDETLFKKYYHHTFYKETWYNENNIEQKYIVTFSPKYMDYQRHIRNEQIARARAALSSQEKCERTRQSDYKRFITKTPVTSEGEVASQTVYGLNEGRIAEEEQYDGFYAVATNLDDDPVQIIQINHRRWEIEECFRIMKHEFSSRPVYVRKDVRITAHFTVCFLALVLFRYLERMLGHKYTCDQIIAGLRQIKFLKINDYGYLPAYTRSEFTDNLHNAFGFRTDYELLTKERIRSIVSLTKKK